MGIHGVYNAVVFSQAPLWAERGRTRHLTHG